VSDPSLSPTRSGFTDAIGIGVLTRIFDRDLVDEVVASSARRPEGVSRRSRLLPDRVVVYLVLALCLFCEEPYEEVLRRLVNGLRFLGNWKDAWQVPTSSAVTQARQRVGEATMSELFDRVVEPIARPGTRGAWFRGLRLMAVDGVIVDAPKTPANTAAFGHGRGGGPFPQLRLVGLGECGTHAIVDAVFDGAADSDERRLLPMLFPTLEPDMLLLADRGFYSYDLWTAAAGTGAHLLWRIKNDLKLPVLEIFPDGSYRSELIPRHIKGAVKQGRRKTIPDEVRIPVRVVEYAIPDRGGDGERIRVMTTILDPTFASAPELAALYQQRWEFELTLDEIEIHQMSSTRLLRSRTPELVRQEIWALLLVHFAIRSFMREAADDIDDDPDRLSFIRTIRVLRRQVDNQAGFSP
jgi:hypothetical protein